LSGAFLAGIIIFALLHFALKGKFDDFIEPLDTKDYRLKDYLHMGFFLLKITGYKYNTLYDKKLKLKTSQLGGSKYAEYYLWVHWANKLTAIIIVFQLVLLIGAAWGDIDFTYPLFAVALLGAVFFGLDKELENKIEKRKLSISLDFPDFLNKLTLLLNAGMTVSKAWERIINENKKNSTFYNEAEFAFDDIQNGKSEALAYEDFARRCRVTEVTKFISILIQNLKKGNSQMVVTLQNMSLDSWEMRKHAARRLGEEASTKLLFPMIFNFLVVVIIVAMPAFMAMQQAS